MKWETIKQCVDVDTGKILSEFTLKNHEWKEVDKKISTVHNMERKTYYKYIQIFVKLGQEINQNKLFT